MTYKRQKRRRAHRRKRGTKQQGGLFPLTILHKSIRAAKTIHDFNKQKGAINKVKFAYNKLGKGKGSLIKVY